MRARAWAIKSSFRATAVEEWAKLFGQAGGVPGIAVGFVLPPLHEAALQEVAFRNGLRPQIGPPEGTVVARAVRHGDSQIDGIVFAREEVLGLEVVTAGPPGGDPLTGMNIPRYRYPISDIDIGIFSFGSFLFVDNRRAAVDNFWFVHIASLLGLLPRHDAN